MSARFIRMVTAAALLAFACAPLAAAANDRSNEREALFAALAAAKSDFEAREVEEKLWKFWLTPPDAASQHLLDASKEAQLNFNYRLSIEHLTKLTEHVPDYSEGWNQLATVLFLAGAWDDSLKAIERTLKLEPKHYGALAGKGLILSMQGHEPEAQIAFRQALAINPWLKERNLISGKPERKI